jgi:enoyl-CoA hydratase
VTDVTELVRYQADGEVATVTLDSPHNRNALSDQLVAELSARLGEAGADRPVRAVVLTHTGRVFCSGADLAAAAEGPGKLGTAAEGPGKLGTAAEGPGKLGTAGTGSLGEAATKIMALLRLITELPKPVIARIAGHVRAGGIGIVGACDLAVAAEGASFAFTEARLGLAPVMISLTTLDIMDPRQAARYYLTGETFGAAAAAQSGLVTAACTSEELDGLVDGLVAQVRETSPQGAAETKKLLTMARRQRLDALGPEMVELSARLFGSDEAQDSIRAFLEKRAPAWRSG